MPVRVLVPQIDANIVDVTVTAWRKACGDRVQTGDVLAELTTDKATFELEAAGSGTVLEILAAEKSVVPCGYVLALLGAPGETDPDAAIVNRALMDAYRAAAPMKTQIGTESLPPAALRPAPATAAASPSSRVRATPRARRLAQEHGIDLARVQAETGVAVVDEAALRSYLPK